MQLRKWTGLAMFVATMTAAVLTAACGQTDKPDPAVQAAKKAASPKQNGEHNYAGRDWCREHGVPESECTRCQPQLVAKFKEKGDWCKKHNRPDSQCFLCHPEKEAEFAADYEARYGEKPPKPDPETPDDESKS